MYVCLTDIVLFVCRCMPHCIHTACLHTTVLPTGKAKVTSSILCEAMEDSENSQDSVGGNVFEESVVDTTKRELYAFK